MKWVSVKDRLPNQETFVLVTYSDNSVSACLYFDKEFYERLYGDDNLEVTHWAELPEPPNTIKSTLSYEEREHIEKGGKWLD